MIDIERLKRHMQDGCRESTEALLREAIRSADLDLLVEVQNECYKRNWKRMETKASANILKVSMFPHNISSLINR